MELSLNPLILEYILAIAVLIVRISTVCLYSIRIVMFAYAPKFITNNNFDRLYEYFKSNYIMCSQKL